jgi:class 3 adenylate cyclase
MTRYLDGIGATTAMAGAVALSTLLTAIVGKLVRGRRVLRRLAPFFPPAVLREMARRRDPTDLAPSRRLVTVLFSDLRGFTALAEMLAPPAVAELLRDYLTEVTQVVFKHGGTLISCAGDSLVALYNAPLDDPAHARNAVRTALELQELTLQMSARWQAQMGATIRPGIGITTGDAVVGTMGPPARLTYTAVGATIDLGSRLQALTREHGVGIVIGESTRRGLDREFLTRRLGEVTGSGATPPVSIHGVFPADIRKQPRAVLEVAATLVLLGAGQTCLVTTRDVGEGGMALGGVPAAWGVGTRVEIRCEGGLLPNSLLAEGVIAWRRADEAGISFVGLDGEAAPTVAEYVATRDRR